MAMRALTIYHSLSGRYYRDRGRGVGFDMPGCSLIVALLALLLSGYAFAQSLGEVAREVRAEKQKGGLQQPKIITNEDIANPVPTQERDATKQGSAKTRRDWRDGQTTQCATAQPPMTSHGEHPKQSSDDDSARGCHPNVSGVPTISTSATWIGLPRCAIRSMIWNCR